jgi:hypothetical protein
MPTPHSTLTGAELHEAKGADSAAADTVLTATGTGTTVFKKLEANNVNTASIKNVNIEKVTFTVFTPATAFDFYLPIDVTKQLINVQAQINGTVTGADLNIEIIRNTTNVLTVPFPVVGTIAGSKVSVALGSPPTFLSTDNMRIRSTSVGVTGAGAVTFLFTFRVL